jgi:hypothetical protein
MVHSISATLIVGYALNFATQSFVYPLLKVRSVRLTEDDYLYNGQDNQLGLDHPCLHRLLVEGSADLHRSKQL